jgi:hypothetical protein
MPTSAVKLAAALEKFVDAQVRQGMYRSRQIAWLRSEIQKGLDSGPVQRQ